MGRLGLLNIFYRCIMADGGAPTIPELERLLECDPATGKLFWKRRSPDLFLSGPQGPERACAVWNTRYAGQETFRNRLKNGYLQGTIFNRKFYAHRVIWALNHGAWPASDLDHINHDRTDNRLSNLRLVSRSENLKNQSRHSRNTSGVTGVVYCSKSQKWWAKITADGQYHGLGYFTDFKAAVAARKQAEKAFGFHKNHGLSSNQIIRLEAS